ncbi:Endonuclease/exonuclease/phosphatase [Trichoderma austrokoningii]
MASRIARHLSCFNPSTCRWSPVVSAHSLGTQILVKAPPPSPFSLITWNADFLSGHAQRRAGGIIDSIFSSGAPPDILFLQEVRYDVRASLLGNRHIRDAFLTTDAEDDVAFEDDRPFATMAFLSKSRFAYGPESQEEEEEEGEGKFMVGPVFREELPSASGRDGLCLDVIPPTAPDTFIRLINVHLDSRDRISYRARQLEKLASALREPGCIGGLLAGDFNSISAEDHELIDENALEDAWLSLYGGTNPDAPTWSVGRRREAEFDPKRLDKVVMLGLKAKEMEILNPGFIHVPIPGGLSKQLEWSDHSGLRCIFTV